MYEWFKNKQISNLVLHNFSFFAKNERWLGEKFFAKNAPWKIDEKITGKTAKNDLKLAKIEQRWPNFSQIQFLFDKIFEFVWKQSYVLLGYLIEIQKLVLT